MRDHNVRPLLTKDAEVNDVLRQCRILLGMTQQAVADKAQIPLQSYQQFKSGKRRILNASFRIACQVIEALDLDITAFFHGEYLMGEKGKSLLERPLSDISPDELAKNRKRADEIIKKIGGKKV